MSNVMKGAIGASKAAAQVKAAMSNSPAVSHAVMYPSKIKPRPAAGNAAMKTPFAKGGENMAGK